MTVSSTLTLPQSLPAPEAGEWFTAAELAEAGLPGLPTDKRSMNRRAREEHWHLRVDTAGIALSRPRIGKGGGTEYHVSLLPGAARLELARRAGAATDGEQANPAADAWRWFESQSAKTKAEAERRLAQVAEIALLEGTGMSRTSAVAEAAARHGTGKATLWSWLGRIDGAARADWLPALAPRRQGGGAEADIEPLLWQVFKSDFLRASAPTLTSCYARTAAIAAEKGMAMPSERTLRRRLEREVDARVILLRRKGEEALRRSLPAQRRTVEQLHAMECVNIDGHKFDVFVRTHEGKVIRPTMVALQDIRSSKMLAWRVAESESAVHVRLAFADLFEKWGIPTHCVLDNGRGFASKWITGGAASRFRFKIKPEEPTGLLTALGIEIHWALPYRGQSKPIERAFRDLCDTVARHPAMEGAYCGNTVLAKPENYGSRAIEWDAFVAHVEREIAVHNARLGRRGRDYRGRSFDQVFAESYATAPIGKATAEQLRMALLAAENKTVSRQTGMIELFGNRYYSDGCSQLHGQRVTVRFDPDNLMRDIHLYAQDGRYLTSAQVWEDTGFLDAASAKASARLLADTRKQVRAAADAEQLLAAAEVARLQAGVTAPEPPTPAVIRPVRHRGQTAAALKIVETPAPRRSEENVFAALGKLRAVE